MGQLLICDQQSPVKHLITLWNRKKSQHVFGHLGPRSKKQISVWSLDFKTHFVLNAAGLDWKSASPNFKKKKKIYILSLWYGRRRYVFRSSISKCVRNTFWDLLFKRCGHRLQLKNENVKKKTRFCCSKVKITQELKREVGQNYRQPSEKVKRKWWHLESWR